MVAEKLNGLALLHVHKDIIVNIDKVIDVYAMKNRGLKFCWINILRNGCLNASRILYTKTQNSVTIHSVQFF